MNPEEAQFILDLRVKVADNKAKGLKARDGIPEDDQKRLYALLRPARAAAASKTNGTKKTKAPAMSDEDADKLLDFS